MYSKSETRLYIIFNAWKKIGEKMLLFFVYFAFLGLENTILIPNWNFETFNKISKSVENSGKNKIIIKM